MIWNDLKQTYPKQWVIVEAIDAYSEDENRVINNLQLVELFGEDNVGALRRYVELHKVNPNKEYYVVHTSRPELNVKEKKWTGIRGAR